MRRKTVLDGNLDPSELFAQTVFFPNLSIYSSNKNNNKNEKLNDNHFTCKCHKKTKDIIQ